MHGATIKIIQKLLLRKYTITNIDKMLPLAYHQAANKCFQSTVKNNLDKRFMKSDNECYMFGSSVLVYGRAERPPTDFSAPYRPLLLRLRVCEVGSECHQVQHTA